MFRRVRQAEEYLALAKKMQRVHEKMTPAQKRGVKDIEKALKRFKKRQAKSRKQNAKASKGQYNEYFVNR